MTKTFRVRFDKNVYSVPPLLVSQQSWCVRANDERVRVFLGTKQVAAHAAAGASARTSKLPRTAPRRSSRSRARTGMACRRCCSVWARSATRYFKVAAAGTKLVFREKVRLVFFVEVFGRSETAEAMAEVMQAGHVGAEYVEYVLRQKKGLLPVRRRCGSADRKLDGHRCREPDLSRVRQP